MTSTNDLTEGEGLLRGLWSALLEVPPEVEPDFMRAGGSSLLLMEIQLGMQKQSGIWIDLDTLDLPIRFEQMCSLLRAQDASRSEVDSSETGVEGAPKPEITVVNPAWPSPKPDPKPDPKSDPKPDPKHDLKHDLKKAWLIGEAIEKPLTLPKQVERIALRDPAAPAVRDGNEVLLYGDLMASANALAAQIRSLDGGSDRVVMIRCDPGIDYCIAVLGAISAGCFASPINPALPESRVKTMFDLADPVAVVGGDGNDGCPRLRVERQGMPDSGLLAIDPPTGLDDPCYALFTSGSTGVPKGVRMHQLPVANLARFEATRNGPEPAARTAQIAPLGFDVAFQELFGTWAAGGELIVIPLTIRRDPVKLLHFLEAHRVTRLYCVPLMLRMIARASNLLETPLPDLREVVTSGEALRIDGNIRDFGRACPELRIINQLEAAETIQTTSIDLGSDADSWPDSPDLGQPIPGVELRVTSPSGETLPRGVEGEIEIGGFGPALGYLGDPETDRFSHDESGRWYRTGDRGEVDLEGGLVYRGRRDHQVKIRGFRIELGDVERNIAALDFIEDVAVVSADVGGTGLELQAMVTTNSGRDEISIAEALAESLPPWMIPRRIRIVQELPSTSSGKIDRVTVARTLCSAPS